MWHLHVAFYKYGHSDNSLLSIDDAVASKFANTIATAMEIKNVWMNGMKIAVQLRTPRLIQLLIFFAKFQLKCSQYLVKIFA